MEELSAILTEIRAELAAARKDLGEVRLELVGLHTVINAMRREQGRLGLNDYELLILDGVGRGARPNVIREASPDVVARRAVLAEQLDAIEQGRPIDPVWVERWAAIPAPIAAEKKIPTISALESPELSENTEHSSE